MVYGILTQQNIGEPFIAGVLPGLLGLAMYMMVIYLGWFSATEAGGIGAGMALVIAMVQRRLGWVRFAAVMKETAQTSVMLYVMLFGAMLFSQLISFSALSRMGILLAILAVFLLLGCVMDTMAIILIFLPLFMPTLVAQGFDLAWIGIVVVVLTEIGLITPPVGMNVFVLKANLPKVPVGSIFRGLVPFIAVDVVRLVLLVAFPSVSLVLVQLMN
jgi:TRAP-type C4-dicarboxylate transport system permease large subunit